MNKYTLQFTNQQQESKFSLFLVAEQKERILQCLLISTLTCAVISVNELIKQNNRLGILYSIWLAAFLLLYLYLSKCTLNPKYYFPFLTIAGIIVPYASYYNMLNQEEFTIGERIVLLLMTNHTVQYFTVYQNFIVSTIVHCNYLAATGVALSLLFGFNIYIAGYGIYSLFWLNLEYKGLQKRRQLFQEANINQSLMEIVDKSVTDKLIVFTYDSDNQRYIAEIFNQAAQNYLETTSINQLLRDTYIKSGVRFYNLGEHIANHYLHKVNQSNMEAITLKGYYKDKKHTIQVRIQIQCIPKLKIILNISGKKQCDSISHHQLQFLQQYEFITSSILNSINQIMCQSRSMIVGYTGIKQALHKYHTKLKLITLFHSDNYHFTLSRYNITLQLIQLIKQSHLLSDKRHSNFITILSDQNLTKLLFQLIIRLKALYFTFQSNSISLQQKLINLISVLNRLKMNNWQQYHLHLKPAFVQIKLDRGNQQTKLIKLYLKQVSRILQQQTIDTSSLPY